MANFKISLEANIKFCKHSYEALEILLAFHDISLDEFLADAMRGQMQHLENLRQEQVQTLRASVHDLDDLDDVFNRPAIHTCQNGGPCAACDWCDWDGIEPAIHTCQNGGPCAACDEEAKEDKE